MQKSARRFTSIAKRAKRTVSTASLESDNRRRFIGERSRSVSEILDSSKAPHIHEHLLVYLGYGWVEEPRSTKELQAGIRNVQANNLAQRSVSITHHDGRLTVWEISGDKLLESPLNFIAQVAPDDHKSSGQCLAISFLSGHNNNQCHVFQAKTSREASDVVQAIQKAYRSASKGLKNRKTSEASHSRPKSSQGVQRNPHARMVMEEEDEVLNVKKIPTPYSPGRKSLSRVSNEIVSTTSGTSSPRTSLASESTQSMGSKLAGWKPKRNTVGQRLSNDSFTREDRVLQLANAVTKIRENNSILREKCSKAQNPSTPFEDALYAMQTENLELLRNYLSCGHVSSDTADVSGNTLLHYAVAMRKLDLVRVICKSGVLSLESAGWNECRVLHRAAAEGLIPILQHLLRRGVSVNSTDMMRRTPLHITCGKMELVECSIALLEYGAQIMASDVLGLRPCDVNPDLREIQNRLINSACESFVTSQVRDSGVVSSPSATPLSISPTSTRPSSIVSAKSHDLWSKSHDSWTTPSEPDVDAQLTDLLDTVSLRAKALNKAYANKTKFRRSMTSMTTRSHGNLSELQEKDEDDMVRRDRLDSLKFPSEFQLYTSAYEVEQGARQVVRAVDQLKDSAAKVTKRGGRIDSGRGLSLDVDEIECDLSHSDPNLVGVVNSRTDEIPTDIPRPFSSAATVGRHTQSDLTPMSLVDSLDQAFDELQDEVIVSRAGPTESPVPPQRGRPRHMGTADQPKRSKEEAMAIMDDIITEMRTFSDDLDSPLPSPPTPHTPLTPNAHTEVRSQSPLSTHAPEVKGQSAEVKSTPPKSLDTTESSTLKKKSKLSAVKRIGSPLTKLRRTSVSSKEKKDKLANFKRKASMPDIPVDRVEVSMSPIAMETVFGQSDNVTPCEPMNTALKLMVTLSSNKECTATLISYICLPKCEAKLLKLAQDRSTPLDMLTDIATLLQNVFESGGGEGRKNALNSGVLDLTIKLLNGRDPIPGTCLSLLNSLLVSEDDTDYLRTILRIPTEPLLLYLDPCELPTEGDTSRRDTAVSVGTSDSGLGHGKLRGASMGSEASEASSGRSTASPALQGPAVTNLEAKRIVLKMLAVASSHHKMQNHLSNERAIGLLADCLQDPSLENVTNAVITLANVAQHTESHKLLIQLGLVDKFYSLLQNGPRPRYHGARALVYLGKLNLLQEFSLFEPTATGYETDVVVTTTDENGHVYARAATIEKCVEFITGDVMQLWGGFHLSIGPAPSPTEDHPLSPKATKEQIINFFLTTYQSFVRPIVLMRLLLHRLATPRHQQNPFNWCLPSEPSTLPHSPQHKGYTIPPTQMSVLTLIGRWLESFPDDFIDYPELQSEVSKVIKRLRLTRGPFIPHTHRLRSLMQDLSRPHSERQAVGMEEELRVPHHENLYNLSKQMVTGGHLPVTMDEAIFFSALQLHIEDVSDPFSHIAPPSLSSTPPKSKKGFTMRLKSALPQGYTKTKTLLKRVKGQIEIFDNLSERNAKHLYIERCQSNPGYDCSFFGVKVPSGGRFKRGGVQKQLLGISSRRVVFLEEKTKELLSTHPLQTVLSVSRESDPCQLVLHLRGDPTGCKVQAESAAAAREIANVLEQCRSEGDVLMDEGTLRDRWSESTHSLFTISAGPGEMDDSVSTPTSSIERGATPPFSSHDLVKNGHTPLEGPLTMSNGIQGTLMTQKSDTLRALTQDDSLVTDLTDSHIGGGERPSFCDCPPDPELPPEINLKHLSLTEVLSCPMEVARQMTLIAHDHFWSVTPVELLQKVNVIPKLPDKGSKVNTDRGSLSPDQQDSSTAIKRLAYRFNQVGNWVAHSILQYEYLDERVEAVQQFIKISKHCLDMGNTSSMMAIVVAGLGSSPIRRLAATWDAVPKTDMDLFKRMDSILEEKSNYKSYRENLSTTAIPAVPYMGVFLKDLTFICDGNPDYLRGGLINLHKRRHVYKTLEEIHHFQQDHYKLHKVLELQAYLQSHQLVPADDLHTLSLTVEPRITRSVSSHGTRSLSTSQKSFFKLSRTGSASASNLHRT